MAIGRRIVLIAALLLTLLVSAGWSACRPEAGLPGTRLLSYVPVDTAFFVGVTQADWARELGAGSGLYRYALESIASDAKAATAAHGPAAGVLVGLLQAQRDAVARGERPFAVHGLPADAVMGAYSVGQTPVLRWQLDDPERFWQTVDAAERRAGTAAAASEKGEAISLRRYALELPGQPLELVLATADGFAVAALHAPEHGSGSLDRILGLERPSGPLTPARFEELARSYGLARGSVAFVDNERLLNPLGEKEGDALAARIGRIVRAAAGPRLPPSLAALGTEGCRQALALLPDFWSGTVIGMTDFDPAKGRLEQRVVLESPHQRWLAGLESAQGKIPALVQAPSTIFGLGIGLDASEWLPAEPADSGESERSQVEATDAEDRDYSECGPIAALQRRAATGGRPDPAVHRILTNVQGVGAAVFRTPPATGPGQRPRLGSALMATSENPDEVHAALQEVDTLESGPIPRTEGTPWNSVRRSADQGPGAGLLLSEAALVPAQPPAGRDEAAALPGLLSFRYRHGGTAPSAVTAVEPWLVALPAGPQQAVRRAVRLVERLPFSLAVDARVGDRGVELDVVLAPGSGSPRASP